MSSLARLAVTLSLAVAMLSGCFGTVGYVGEYEEYGYPPEAYIATATPVYYGGYASYWYGGRWYHRDGGRWRSYRQEPVYLRDYRVHASVPVIRQPYGRTYYGHVHVNPVRVNPPSHGAVPVRR
jgi:hypothetical protein